MRLCVTIHSLLRKSVGTRTAVAFFIIMLLAGLVMNYFIVGLAIQPQ